MNASFGGAGVSAASSGAGAGATVDEPNGGDSSAIGGAPSTGGAETAELGGANAGGAAGAPTDAGDGGNGGDNAGSAGSAGSSGSSVTCSGACSCPNTGCQISCVSDCQVDCPLEQCSVRCQPGIECTLFCGSFKTISVSGDLTAACN